MEVILSTVLNSKKNNNEIDNYFSSLSIEMIEKIKYADNQQKIIAKKKTIWERRMQSKIKFINTSFYIDNNIRVLEPSFNTKNKKNIMLEYTLEEF